MIGRADITQSWMTSIQRIAAAALAEVGERVDPPRVRGASFTCSAPLAVGYRASVLARIACRRAVDDPNEFLRRWREINIGEPPVDADDLASMWRFYNLHIGETA